MTTLLVQVLTQNDMPTCIKLSSELHFQLSVTRHKVLSPKCLISLQRPNTICDTLIRRNRTVMVYLLIFDQSSNILKYA